MRSGESALMFRRLFLSHPRQVGESYLQHQRVALSIAVPLLTAGLAALVHALVPGLYQRTAGNTIRHLYARLEQR
jgi:hypothetical protein